MTNNNEQMPDEIWIRSDLTVDQWNLDGVSTTKYTRASQNDGGEVVKRLREGLTMLEGEIPREAYDNIGTLYASILADVDDIEQALKRPGVDVEGLRKIWDGDANGFGQGLIDGWNMLIDHLRQALKRPNIDVEGLKNLCNGSYEWREDYPDLSFDEYVIVVANKSLEAIEQGHITDNPVVKEKLTTDCGRIKKLEDALRFYSEEDNYKKDCKGMSGFQLQIDGARPSEITKDNGTLAKSALEPKCKN